MSMSDADIIKLIVGTVVTTVNSIKSDKRENDVNSNAVNNTNQNTNMWRR